MKAQPVYVIDTSYLLKQPVYVIDTSYLLELYAVPGHSTQEAVDEIRSRFKDAVKQNARLYVTVPSIYELANHIAGVSNGNARWSLAKKLQDDILDSLDKAEPWMIIPSPRTQCPAKN